VASVQPEAHRHPNRRPLRSFHAVDADLVGTVAFLRLGERRNLHRRPGVELGGIAYGAASRAPRRSTQVPDAERMLVTASTGIPTSGLP
jgi:hypothetical protein